ncbi:MAG: FAD-dependent oxidoreductase [Verrucomicrobiales bacterium]|nr:FAD-dependent oxidoreductase [Verrucomicrobiales bacterium]
MRATSEKQNDISPTGTQHPDRDGKIVILGGGPAGLATAYKLSQAGKEPILLERSPKAGGLMRGIVRNGFSVDLGRKEIYERIPEVTALWEELLNDNFVSYPHRVGLLHGGNIIEYSGSFRGPLRGIPMPLLAKALFDLLRSKIGAIGSSPPQTYEERWHRSWGVTLSRILSQGFSEKFYGTLWKDLPADFTLRKSDLVERKSGVQAGIRSIWKKLRTDASEGKRWRHPRCGTQQLVDGLVENIQALGGTIRVQAQVSALEKEGNLVTHVILEDGERIPVSQVISAVPVSILSSLLGNDEGLTSKVDRNRDRETILLYLFLDSPTGLEHAWINVSCPDLKVGRITNYEAFGGEMVPEGKGCLAVTIFVHPGDELIRESDEAIEELIISEMTSSGILDRSTIEDRLLIRIPGAEASNEYQTWETDPAIALQEKIRSYENVYDVNRAGIDVALFAGIKAAEAVTTGSRTSFDEDAAPERALI